MFLHTFSINYILRKRSVLAETYKGKSKLENALEKFKSTIRNGDTRLGIPPLDPFTADKLPINLHKTGKIEYVSIWLLKKHVDC